jgi:hypothetical protein
VTTLPPTILHYLLPYLRFFLTRLNTGTSSSRIRTALRMRWCCLENSTINSRYTTLNDYWRATYLARCNSGTTFPTPKAGTTANGETTMPTPFYRCIFSPSSMVGSPSLRICLAVSKQSHLEPFSQLSHPLHTVGSQKPFFISSFGYLLERYMSCQAATWLGA